MRQTWVAKRDENLQEGMDRDGKMENVEEFFIENSLCSCMFGLASGDS